MQALKDRVILLTGGGDGIGWECAKAYALAGANVCIANRRPLSEDKQFFIKTGDHLYVGCDVSVDDDVKRCIDTIVNKYGRLDVIHNNAGTASPSKPLHETTDEEWNKLLDTNLRSVLHTTRHGIRYLKQSKGNIINTSSLVGEIGQDNHAAYVGTKGAMNALTKAMALDYAPFGIRVNAVLPAGVSTPMLTVWSAQQKNPEQINEYLDKIHALGYLPQGDVIADACVFLASDAARFITGTIMPVSGGAELGYRAIMQTNL